MSFTEAYAAAKQRRQQITDRILNSRSEKKVIVAGPGTGKTHLFKSILADKPNSLTLSFVNALVDDLQLELYDMAEVRTLHSFARSALKKARRENIEVYPALDKIIAADAKILIGAEVNFRTLFEKREEKPDLLQFYKARREYYQCYGFTDVIFAAVLYFEKYEDRIPEYQQIVVDEFQDFNALEVSLIELLAKRSPIVLAGDDDQALYDFKHASPDYIRKYFSSKDSAFEAFTLPYCSRCPKVVIDAANDIISAAQREGYLTGRINKKFEYFECEEKDKINTRHPCLDFSQEFASRLPWAISDAIKTFAANEKAKFDVLIISPYNQQCVELAGGLRSKGFRNVSCAVDESDEPTLLEGAKVLLNDKHSNIGWRVVAENALAQKELTEVVEGTREGGQLEAHLAVEFKRNIKKILTRLRHLRSGEILDEEFVALLDDLGIDPLAAAKLDLVSMLDDQNDSVVGAIRTVPICITTFQKSKGLAADLVVVANCDDRYMLSGKMHDTITDRAICNFLVALTRARKKAVVMSTTSRVPKFVSWIKQGRQNVIRTIEEKRAAAK